MTVIVWVTGLVGVARRLFPPGERAVVIVVSVVAVIVIAGVASLEIGLVSGIEAPPVVTALAFQALSLFMTGVPSVVFRQWGRRVDHASGWLAAAGAPWGSGTSPVDRAVAAPSPLLGSTEWHPQG